MTKGEAWRRPRRRTRTLTLDADAPVASAAAAPVAAAPASAPRAKIAIALKKKSKPSSKKASLVSCLQRQDAALVEDYSTVAEEAELILKKRREEGTLLFIPCSQGKVAERKDRPGPDVLGVASM